MQSNLKLLCGRQLKHSIYKIPEAIRFQGFCIIWKQYGDGSFVWEDE